MVECYCWPACRFEVHMDRELFRALERVKGCVIAATGYIDLARDGEEMPRALEKASEVTNRAVTLLEEMQQLTLK
jgi:hypothetical protein